MIQSKPARKALVNRFCAPFHEREMCAELDAVIESEIAERTATLEAFTREALMNCSIDNHGGADDFECAFCNKARALLAGAK
jgi:hypothetical protein